MMPTMFIDKGASPRECNARGVQQRTTSLFVKCKQASRAVQPVLGRRALSFLFLGVFSAIAPVRCCFAQVQLPAVNLGETNFEDGFASPGWFLQEFTDSYVAGNLRDGRGNRIPGNGRTIVTSTTTHVVFVNKRPILGTWLAAEILQPLVDLDFRFPIASSSRIRGFGDTTFGVGLQWAPRKVKTGVLAQRFILDVTAPTGTYSDRRPVNVGAHLVSLDPYYAITYERQKIEFSARLHYLWNSSNSDPFLGSGITNIQPGQAFHVNYATSYEVRKGIRLGFNGYWLQQTTDHRINNLSVAGSKERTIGLGPGLQFGGQGIWLHLNAYMETDVRNRPSGVKVTLRISKSLPANHE